MFAMNLFEQCHTSRQRELTARLFHMYGSQGMSYFFSDNVTKGAPRDRPGASSQPSNSSRRGRRATPSTPSRLRSPIG